MNIQDALLPELERRFPNRGLRFGMAPDPVAIFPALHESVGDVEIWVDEVEATIGIGKITHSHFNPYDNSLSKAELACRITEDVVDFLTDLFSDQVQLWVAVNSSSGGWIRLFGDPPKIRENAHNFLWSGPLPSHPRAAP